MMSASTQAAEVLLARPTAAAVGVAAGVIFPDMGNGSLSFPWAAQPVMNPVTESTAVMAPPLASPKQQPRWQYGTSLLAAAPLAAASSPAHSASPTSTTTTSSQSVPVAPSPPPLSHHQYDDHHHQQHLQLSPENLDEFIDEGEEDGDEMFIGAAFEDMGSMSDEDISAHTELLQQQQQQQQHLQLQHQQEQEQQRSPLPAKGKKAAGAGRTGKKATQKSSTGGADDGAGALHDDEVPANSGGSSNSLGGEDQSADFKERPNYSYARLAAMAIEDDPRKRCTVGEIYLWIEQRFPFYKCGSPWWKNCIRHNLSMKKCFVRIQSQGGNLWGLDPNFRDDILSDSPAPKSLLRKPRRNSTSSATGTAEPTPVTQAMPVPRRNSAPQTKTPGASKRKPSPKGTRNPTKPLKRSNSASKIELGSDPASFFSGDESTAPLGLGRRNSEGTMTPPASSMGGSSSGAQMSAFDDTSLLLEETWLNEMMAGMDASAAHSRVDTFSPQFRSAYPRIFQTPPNGFVGFHEDEAHLSHAVSSLIDPLFRLTPSGHLDTSTHIDWDLPSFA